MNRESFSRTENGISVFMDLMTESDSSLVELAIYTLIHFKYCKEALEVCIIVYLYIIIPTKTMSTLCKKTLSKKNK